MTSKKIGDDILRLYKELGNLRTATSPDHPEYENIRDKHRRASDMAEQAVGIAVDEGNADYEKFSDQIAIAVDLMKKEKDNIKKLAEAISIAAEAIAAAGRIIQKFS